MRRSANKNFYSSLLTRDPRLRYPLLMLATMLIASFLFFAGGPRPFIQQIALHFNVPIESFIPGTGSDENIFTDYLDINQLKNISLNNSDFWTQITVKTGDTLAKIFQRLGLSARQLDQILTSSDHSNYLKKLFPGQILHFFIENEELKALAQPIDPARTLYVIHEAEGFKSVLHEKEIESRLAFASAHINNSLLGSGKRAGLDTKLLMQLVDIFGYDIDFAMNLQPNDRFRVLFEEEYIEGQKTRTGNVLAAEFINDGHVYRAVRFEDQDGRINYYAPTGESLRKAFIRTPVSFTHISSHFNLHRTHPILHKIRAHRGVDYAAPTGTPVHAAGDGHLDFIGAKGGFGNTIVLQHGKRYSTLYGHLSRFATGLKRGQRVRQGQVIGYVGMTGLASGPHLHYEFRVDGIHRNPLTVKVPMSDTVHHLVHRKFKKHANDLLVLMDQHEKLNSTE